MSAIRQWQGRLRKGAGAESQQSLVQSADWKRPSVRWGLGGTQTALLVFLVIIGLGPILWLAKSAITPTQDTLANPMAIFPHGFAWSNISNAWDEVDIGLYIWNTAVIAFGSWLCQIVVATTGAFALSVLRPKWGRVITASLLTTLFVPTVVLLVPLYLEVVHPPLINHSFINSYWAIWLPAGASAFNVIIMKRFFDNLPREIFEAARIFAVLASWKDFLWPLLVLSDPGKQPVSVRLPTIAGQTDLGVFLAAMLIACLVLIVGFLIFQRSFVRGTGLSGALKG